MPIKSALIAATALLLAAPVQAQSAREPLRLSLGYDGRLSVIKVLEMQFDQRVGPTGFSAGARLRSYGILAAFKHFDIRANAMGRIAAEEVQADQFGYINEDGKRRRQVQVNWRPDDVVATSQPAFGNLGDPPASREQRLAAADPLTQLMRITLAAAIKPCEGAPRLFDGKQLYELAFSGARADSPGDDLRALGVTHLVRCSVRYNEIAGFKKKPPSKRNGGLKGPISVAFGQMGQDGPWVLADVRADTPIGPADIALRRVQVVHGQGQG
ncbi:MAG TPA: hypothetical protein VGI79_04990 [Caulobacteraceae bacterium]|jgi:hypothetical protein